MQRTGWPKDAKGDPYTQRKFLHLEGEGDPGHGRHLSKIVHRIKICILTAAAATLFLSSCWKNGNGRDDGYGYDWRLNTFQKG